MTTKELAIQMEELHARWIAVALSYMLGNLPDLEYMHRDVPLHDLEDGLEKVERLPTEEELEAILHLIRKGYRSLGQEGN